MKTTNKIILIIAVIIILVLLAVMRNRPKTKTDEEGYQIDILGEKYSVSEDLCAGLSIEKVKDIANKIFCANHNVESTFKDVSTLSNKDLQLAVWFEKYKLKEQKNCTTKEFEQCVKEIYNINYTNHQSLENTLEYSNEKYKFIDIKYTKYQIPIIERIDRSGENQYTVAYTLTNPNESHKHSIKYNATFEKQGENLYIKTITGHSV